MFMKHLSEMVGAFSLEKYVGCTDFCTEICGNLWKDNILLNVESRFQYFRCRYVRDHLCKA